MKNLIQFIIQREVVRGCVFDAHSIIEYLLLNHSDDYLSSYRTGNTEYYHSEISKIIATFEGSIIERIGESWSRNIHNNFTKNICWKKI